MKHFAVIIVLVLGCNSLFANNQNREIEKILFQSYDSIRNEMIKTACEIGGIKDSAILKMISEGRVDSALANSQIDSVMLQLINLSNKKLSGTDYKKYNDISRSIRANFMGQLLINNYKREDDILRNFKIHKLGLDSLYNETSDFMNAIGNDSALKAFQARYPDSKFCKLISSKKKKTSDEKVDYVLIAIMATIAIAVILAMLYFAVELKKSKRTIVKMQNQRDIKLDRNSTLKQENVHIQEPVIMLSPVTQATQRTDEQQSSFLEEKSDTSKISDKIDFDKINAFAEHNDNWTIVGASVIGNSHISMDLPCQDSNKYVYLRQGWGIAITSDGAGSAKHSDVGSRIVVERGIHYFQSVIEQKKWIENSLLPTEAEWTSIAYTTLKAVRDDLEKFSVSKNLDFKSLSATIVVVIHSPYGFLVTHVGDGRAGYKDDTGAWNALITPHKGEEANQTIFLTSDFWNLSYYVMSGVMVPESHVCLCKPQAFTLMSDGCEHTAWQCNMKDEKTGRYYDPNKPFDRFFNPLIDDLVLESQDDLKNRWSKFIISGNSSFMNEPDDKTMILGVLK